MKLDEQVIANQPGSVELSRGILPALEVLALLQTELFKAALKCDRQHLLDLLNIGEGLDAPPCI